VCSTRPWHRASNFETRGHGTRAPAAPPPMWQCLLCLALAWRRRRPAGGEGRFVWGAGPAGWRDGIVAFADADRPAGSVRAVTARSAVNVVGGVYLQCRPSCTSAGEAEWVAARSSLSEEGRTARPVTSMGLRLRSDAVGCCAPSATLRAPAVAVLRSLVRSGFSCESAPALAWARG
jgi:hypothetical protein